MTMPKLVSLSILASSVCPDLFLNGFGVTGNVQIESRKKSSNLLLITTHQDLLIKILLVNSSKLKNVN